MKIAVYGDSFACGHPKTRDFHWYTLLANKLSADVISYGLGATPLYYSFKLFQDNYKNYDLNIICVSHFQRFPYCLKIKGQLEWPNSISSIDNIERRYKNSLTAEEQEHLKNIRGWYEASDDNFMMDIQEMFLQSMELECKNIVLLPSFNYNGSFNKERTQKSNLGVRGSMIDFSAAQNAFWEDQNLDDVWQENFLRMACHYTPETNYVVADAVYNYIFNKQEFNAPEIIPQNNNRDYYFQKT